MLTDVAGVLVGQWTDEVARTGCTVIVLPDGSVASGEVRGGAPASHEFELLAPSRLVEHVDAIVLTGGSAFGLDACSGVVQWCEEQGRGHVTAFGRVPIVVGLAIYDLGEGSASMRPTAAHGRAAASTAGAEPHSVGPVGAGTGATSSKWRGESERRPGGLGAATVRYRDLVVSALVVANPIGDIVDAGRIDDADLVEFSDTVGARTIGTAGTNTTIGVIATNARLDKAACHLLAQSGHHGIARAVWPSHLSGDGDAVIAVSVPDPVPHSVPGSAGSTSSDAGVGVPLDIVRALAVEAVARAIRTCGSAPTVH